MATIEEGRFISVRFPRHIARQLRLMAAERDLSRHRLIQQIIVEWLLQSGYGVTSTHENSDEKSLDGLIQRGSQEVVTAG